MAAYLQLRDAHDRAVQAADQQAASQEGSIGGGQPESVNRRIEQAELKRASLELLRNEPLGTSQALTFPADQAPAMDAAVAFDEGTRVQFFEQAFEWEAMTYYFYPYFWANASQWPALSAAADADLLFQQFLAAGSARVQVPVRPGYEEAVAYYLATDQIWDGGQPPQINDPLYVSILDDIRRASGAPEGGIPVGDLWDVRIPTTLVLLQDQIPLV